MILEQLVFAPSASFYAILIYFQILAINEASTILLQV